MTLVRCITSVRQKQLYFLIYGFDVTLRLNASSFCVAFVNYKHFFEGSSPSTRTVTDICLDIDYIF